MKTAVSIPNDIFEQAEKLARKGKRSRSDVYARALAEYVARHAPDSVTEAMDKTIEALNEPPDTFVAAAARKVLRRSEW